MTGSGKPSPPPLPKYWTKYMVVHLHQYPHTMNTPGGPPIRTCYLAITPQDPQCRFVSSRGRGEPDPPLVACVLLGKGGLLLRVCESPYTSELWQGALEPERHVVARGHLPSPHQLSHLSSVAFIIDYFAQRPNNTHGF